MAKKDEFVDKDIDGDDFDFDALDNELDNDDFGDFDDSGDKPSGSRKPIGVFSPSSVVREAVSVETVKQIGEKIGSEFYGIGSAYDSTINVLSDLSRANQDMMTNIAPSINQAKRAASIYLPKIEKMLPEKLYAKLGNILETDDGPGPESELQARDASISASLAEVFSAQQDVTKDQYVRNKADQMIQMRLQSGQHAESTTVLFQIRNLVKSNQVFFEGTFRKYLMKSLELKYKMLFLTKDILDKNILQTRILESKLEAIKINSALPDVVKRHKSEEARQMLRERIYGKAISTVGDWTSGFQKNLTDNIKTKVFDQFTTLFNDVVGGTAEMVEGLEEQRQMSEEMGERTQSPLTKLVAFLTKKLLITTGTAAIKSGIGKQQFEDFDSAVKGFSDSIKYRMKEFAANNDGFLGDAVKMVLPVDPSTPAIENILAKRGTEDVSFDVVTRRSIIEIIPGLLSKINQQSTITAKALSFYVKRKLPFVGAQFDEAIATDEIVFDRDSEDFVNVADYKAKLAKKAHGTKKTRTENVQDVIDQLYTGYMKRSKTDKGFQESLPAITRFLANLSKHTEIVLPERILKYLRGKELSDIEQSYMDKVLEDINEKDRKELAKVLVRSFFKKASTGTVDQDVKNDTVPLLARLATDNDEYKTQLNEYNAYGGRRFAGSTFSTTDDNIERSAKKIREKYISKHGVKKFGKDPKIRAQFEKEVALLKQRQGVDVTAVRDIQADVDHTALLERAKERRQLINKEHQRREKERKVVDETTLGERAKAGAQDAVKKMVKPFTRVYENFRPNEAVAEDDPEDLSFTARTRRAYQDTKKAATESETYKKAAGVVESLKETPIYQKTKQAVKDHFDPITPEQADDISSETGVPNRDEVQITGPGAYFQGAKRELHIPLDEASDVIKDKLAEVSSGVKSRVNEAAEQVKGSKVVKDGAKKLARVEAEALLFAYRNSLPSNVKELKQAIADRSEALGLTKQYVGLRDKVTGLYKTHKIDERVGELKQRIKDKQAEIDLTKTLGEKFDTFRETVKNFDFAVESNKLKRRFDKLVERGKAEVQLFGYQEGFELTKEGVAGYAKERATDAIDSTKKTTTGLLDSGKAKLGEVVDQAKRSRAGNAVRNFIGRKQAEILLAAYRADIEMTPEGLMAFAKEQAQEVVDDVKGSKIVKKTKAVINRKQAEILLEAYRAGVEMTPAGIMSYTKDRIKEKITDTTQTVKDFVSPTNRSEVYQQANAKVDEVIDFAKGKFGFLSSVIPQEYLKKMQEAVVGPVAGMQPAVAVAGTDGNVVYEIKDLLTKQFTIANDNSVKQLEAINQIVINLARQEILTHGDASNKTKIGILSRTMKPTQGWLGKAGSLVSRGAKAYVDTSVNLYKGLFGVTTKMVPNMIRGVGGATATAGKAVGGILPGLGKAAGKGISAIWKAELDILKSMTSGVGSIAKLGFRAGKSLLSKKQRFVDVYRKDEVDLGKPLMKGLDIQAGKYVDGDGEILKDSLSIVGPIFDAETKQLVVSSADIQHGLVDMKNNPLEKSSGGALELISKGARLYGKFLKGTAQFGVDGISTILGAIFGRKKGGSGITDKDALQEIVGDPLKQLIELVADIKKHITPETIREGSYADYRRDRREELNHKVAKIQDTKNVGRVGALGMIGGMIGGHGGGTSDTPSEQGTDLAGEASKYGIGGLAALGTLKYGYGKVKGMFGFGDKAAKAAEATKAAAGAAKVGVKKPGILRRGITGALGQIKKAGDIAEHVGGKIGGSKTMMAAKKFASSGATKLIGKTVLKRAAVVGAVAGATALGIVGAPVVAAALTAAGIASTGYDIYKWKRGKNRRLMLTELRNEAYHVPEDKIKVLLSFEDEIAEILDDKKPSLTADQAKKYIKEFGLDPRNPKHFEYFRFWYVESFLPIFQASIDLFGEKFGIKFIEQAKLHDSQLTEYKDALNNASEFQRLKASSTGLTVESADAHIVSKSQIADGKSSKSTVELPAPVEAKKMADKKTETILSSTKDAVTDVGNSFKSAITKNKAVVSSATNKIIGGGDGVSTPLKAGSATPKDWAGPYGDPSGRFNDLANHAAFNASAIETRGGTMRDRPGSQFRGEFQIGHAKQKEMGLSSSDMQDRELVRAKVVAHYERTAARLEKDGIPVTAAALYGTWQQGYAGYKHIYKAAQKGTEVSAEIRGNMDANLPHGVNGKMSPGADPATWLAGWENNVVGDLSGSQANVASTTPSPTRGTSTSDASTATTSPSGIEKTLSSTTPQPSGIEKTVASRTETQSVTPTVVTTPAPENEQQVALLAEQNSILKEMTNLLGGINKNTGTTTDGKVDNKLIAKLDSLIDTLSKPSGMKGSKSAVASNSPQRHNSSMATGGINIARQQYAS